MDFMNLLAFSFSSLPSFSSSKTLAAENEEEGEDDYDFFQITRRPTTEISPRASAATHRGYNSCSAAWRR